MSQQVDESAVSSSVVSPSSWTKVPFNSLYGLGGNFYVSVYRGEDKVSINVCKITNRNRGIVEYGIKLSPYEFCHMILFRQKMMDGYEEKVLAQEETKTYHLGGTVHLDLLYNGGECAYQIIHAYRLETGLLGEVDL